MRDSESDISNDISLRRLLIPRHPFLRKRILRRLSSLSNVFSGGVELSIDVGRDPHVLRSEWSSTGDNRVGLREERREIFAHNLRD